MPERIEEMKACARTLLNFQGGAVIKRYVFGTIQPLGRYMHI
jgi:hypothetical protein